MKQDAGEHLIAAHDVETWVALGAGALLLVAGGARRPKELGWYALVSSPLLYRGVTGRWPLAMTPNGSDTRSALGGNRGIHVRESIRLERPLAEVYRYWRRLENLPAFMSHLVRVTETSDRTSHWVAGGPAGISVEWDAEIINEEPDSLLAWRSLAGSDVQTAGSVHFDTVRGGRSTQITVHMQYAPPAGKAGALIASLFGRNPTQTIREDLRHFKQRLEAGEIPNAGSSTEE
jgi:uncharacterized membrane protein